MKPIVCNGWQIYFHPVFFDQWQELVEQVIPNPVYIPYLKTR